jgi:hypothetical protein
MTDKKISQLPEITTPATSDIIPVVDVTANTTKKITAANLSTFINNNFPAETIRDTIGAMLTGNTETDITVTHDDPNDKINFVVSVSASNLPSSIDATKIADGSVSDAEFQRLDGVTSAIQTQLNNKLDKSGGTMTGVIAMGSNAITTSSTVDGRDVSADGTKLDSIESSATADQTNAEIRTAVEAASDSNVFTDADHTKLNSIESSATADQTNAEIRTAVEAASDSNVFTDADHTKLNAIEASADVTDTANVTSAGALMDSELTNLAAVKGINQALATTSSPTFAGITGPLTGNASTASTLATARTINLGGEVTGSASFNGGSDITITGTIAANSIGVNELALVDGTADQFIKTDGSGTISFASVTGATTINNAAVNRLVSIASVTSDFDGEPNLTFDGSTLALTGNMTATGTVDGVDISARDSVLTSTTTTANAALPKAGGAMTGAITSTGDFTVDVAGDIILDSDSGAWRFKDNGGSIIELSVGAGNSPTFYSANSDADIVFKGNDGGSAITALTLDMSNDGKATFNSSVDVGNHLYIADSRKIIVGDGEDLVIKHDGSNSKIETATGSTGDLYIASQRSGSDLYLRAENDILIQPQGGENGIVVQGDGGVVIYNDNVARLETDASGANVSGLLDVSSKVVVAGGTDATSSDGAIRTAGGISAAKKMYVGTDLTVANDVTVGGTLNASSTQIITSNTPIISFIESDQSNKQYQIGSFGAAFAVYDASASAFRYVIDTNGNHALNGGTTVTGNIAVTGTVDGVDIAARDAVLTSTTSTATSANTTANAALPKAGGTMTGDLTLNGADIVKSGSADLTLDSGGRINLSADDNGEIVLYDGSSAYGQLKDDSDNLIIQSLIQDKDIQIRGNDGGTVKTFLTFDSSDNGNATFNSGDVTVTGSLQVNNAIVASGNITAFSDERLKSDIKTIDNALDKVSQMRGVTFTKDDKLSSGVIAQEMEKVAPELVVDGEYKSVAYGNTIGYLIEAIKELKIELDKHKVGHCDKDLEYNGVKIDEAE